MCCVWGGKRCECGLVKFRKQPAQQLCRDDLWNFSLRLGQLLPFGGGEAAFALCDDDDDLERSTLEDPPIKY